jgi:hypothetical protein
MPVIPVNWVVETKKTIRKIEKIVLAIACVLGLSGGVI